MHHRRAGTRTGCHRSQPAAVGSLQYFKCAPLFKSRNINFSRIERYSRRLFRQGVSTQTPLAVSRIDRHPPQCFFRHYQFTSFSACYRRREKRFGLCKKSWNTTKEYDKSQEGMPPFFSFHVPHVFQLDTDFHIRIQIWGKKQNYVFILPYFICKCKNSGNNRKIKAVFSFFFRYFCSWKNLKTHL